MNHRTPILSNPPCMGSLVIPLYYTRTLHCWNNIKACASVMYVHYIKHVLGPDSVLWLVILYHWLLGASILISMQKMPQQILRKKVFIVNFSLHFFFRLINPKFPQKSAIYIIVTNYCRYLVANTSGPYLITRHCHNVIINMSAQSNS